MPVTAENKGKCVDSPNQIKNTITAGFMYGQIKDQAIGEVQYFLSLKGGGG